MDEGNLTNDNPSWKLDYPSLPQFVICFLGAVSHSLLLCAFYKDPLKCFKHSGTFLVMNLAVADFIICLVTPVYLNVKVSVIYKTIRFILATTINVSIATIISISIDRFILVARLIKHSYFIKGKVLTIWPACIWLTSIIIPTKRQIFGERSSELVALNSTAAIIGILSAVLYAFTYFKLKKQSRNMQALQSSIESRAQRIRILKEKQFLKTIIIIACVAVICIVPSSILKTIYMAEIPIVTYIYFCMLHINFSVNPLIYFLRLPNYRKTFYLLYCGRR